MKNKLKTLMAVFIFLSVFSFGFNIVSAQNADCNDSFAPGFICDRVASLTQNFGFSSIISLFLTVAIFGLVLFFLFSIIKAGFAWINKSSDDKSRAAAIKAISNAVIAFVSVLLLSVLLFVVTAFLGINDVPNALYACYSKAYIDQTPPAAQFVDPYTGAVRSASSIREISNVFAYEGKSEGNPVNKYNLTKATFGGGVGTSLIFDGSITSFMNDNLYCKDNKTGQEYTQPYVIMKRVGVKKSS